MKFAFEIPDQMRAQLVESSVAREYLWVHDIQPILMANLKTSLLWQDQNRRPHAYLEYGPIKIPVDPAIALQQAEALLRCPPPAAPVDSPPAPVK